MVKSFCQPKQVVPRVTFSVCQSLLSRKNWAEPVMPFVATKLVSIVAGEFVTTVQFAPPKSGADCKAKFPATTGQLMRTFVPLAVRSKWEARPLPLLASRQSPALDKG